MSDTKEGRIRGYVVPTPAPHDDILMWLPKSGAVTSAYLVQNALVGQPSTHPKYGTVVHIKGGKISAPAVVPSQLFTVVKKHADMSSSGKKTPLIIVGLRSVMDGVGEILGIYDNGVILIPAY